MVEILMERARPAVTGAGLLTLLAEHPSVCMAGPGQQRGQLVTLMAEVAVRVTDMIMLEVAVVVQVWF
jgi:hypothetical protein